MKMHQLGVKVEGWQPITPVTVDQVGVYFRHAASETQFRVCCYISLTLQFDEFS